MIWRAAVILLLALAAGLLRWSLWLVAIVGGSAGIALWGDGVRWDKLVTCWRLYWLPRLRIQCPRGGESGVSSRSLAGPTCGACGALLAEHPDHEIEGLYRRRQGPRSFHPGDRVTVLEDDGPCGEQGHVTRVEPVTGLLWVKLDSGASVVKAWTSLERVK